MLVNTAGFSVPCCDGLMTTAKSSKEGWCLRLYFSADLSGSRKNCGPLSKPCLGKREDEGMVLCNELIESTEILIQRHQPERDYVPVGPGHDSGSVLFFKNLWSRVDGIVSEVFASEA